MAGKAKPVPDGFTTVTPHLIIRDAAKAIDFYKKAFGAEEVCRMPGPGGKLMHAEIKIGNAMIMIADESPEMGCVSPQALKGTATSIHLYVEDTDKVFKRAVDAGAKTLMPPMDMFWGDRFSKVSDPFGHEWTIGTHQKDLTENEMAAAAQAAMSQMCGPGKQ